jgi:hypothetical protein
MGQEPALASNGKERRRHQRFRTKNETLVFLGKETGIILDISRGGISFALSIIEEEHPALSSLDIFFAPSRFYLPQLPVSLVNEVPIRPPSRFTSLQTKRLSMKFGTLSIDQQARLEDFILQNTVVES